MEKNWEKTMKKIGRKRMKKIEKKNNAKKDIKNGQRRKDSSQTDLRKGIPRNRQRLWNQISEQDSEQGVEGDARLSSVE